MISKIVFKEKIVPILLIIFGMFLLLYNFKSFIHSIELYESFRFGRDFKGCIFGGRQAFPFLEFVVSISGFFWGIILIKRINLIFRILTIFLFTVTIYHLIISLIILIYCWSFNCIPYLNILEYSGLLFFTIIILNYYKFDWKKEISNFGSKKTIIFVILLFIITYFFKEI